jgi:hypothetical protein
LKSIDDFAFGYSPLKTIAIPNSVVNLGVSSFIWCAALEEIRFEVQSSLETIGESAFSYSGLKQIAIPSSVRIIGDACFYRCGALETLQFDPGSHLVCIGERAFCAIGCPGIALPNTIREIRKSAFSHCQTLVGVDFLWESGFERIPELGFFFSRITSIVIPKSVVALGRMSFAACKYLSEVSFEAGSHLERVEERAFCDSSLKTIALPKSVHFVDGSAFVRAPICSLCVEPGGRIICADSLLIDVSSGRLIRYLGSFADLVLPASIRILGRSCFAGCRWISSLCFERQSQLAEIETSAFRDSSLLNLHLPRSVIQIHGSAFTKTCVEHVSFDSESHFTISIGFLCNAANTVLIRYFGTPSCVVIPKGIETLGPSCFACSSSIQDVSFETGSALERIEDHAFYKSSIRRVAIPPRVVLLADFCFCQCTRLLDVFFECPSHLERIGKDAFAYTSIRNITLRLLHPDQLTFDNAGCTVTIISD